jgi:hypothetical protein
MSGRLVLRASYVTSPVAPASLSLLMIILRGGRTSPFVGALIDRRPAMTSLEVICALAPVGHYPNPQRIAERYDVAHVPEVHRGVFRAVD